MSQFRRMFRYILRYKYLVMLAFLSSVCYASLNGFTAFLSGRLIPTDSFEEVAVAENQDFLDRAKLRINGAVDRMLDGEDAIASLNRLCILIIIVILLKNFFEYAQGFTMAFVEQAVSRNLRKDLYDSYHRLPLQYFQRSKTGDMISRVTNDCTVINTNFNSSLLELMKEPVNILILFILMVIINWELTLATFLIAPPSFFIITKINHKLRRRTRVTQDKISSITSVLEETISNIRIVKAFAMEDFEKNQFKGANDSYFRSQIKLARIRRLCSPITEILGVSTAVVVLYIGGRMVYGNMELDAKDFFTFIIALLFLMQSAKKLSDTNAKLQMGIAASGRVFEIIDRKSEVADPPAPIVLNGLSKGISFRNVYFEYEPGIPVLDNIELDVKVGESIAIVGPSGGGKSTLVDLLPRFFDPLRGSVELDGVDIRKYSLSSLRNLFGIVTQETFMFHDTVRANIAYGRPDIPMEKIIEAAKTAYAHDFIIGLENGYDTIIGDRGAKLSGGQKQRIVIARAILKNPPILIFDEATSALDSESEAEVQEAINKLLHGRTAFVIAHRLSTIKKADRIIVLDNGKIVDIGTHDTLQRKKGLYKKLYDLQFSIQQNI